jgi:uncharacterized protein YegP (UPF0339 family)
MERFVITRNSDGMFQFSYKDRQGRTIFYSGSYTRKTMCIKGICSVKYNSQDSVKFNKKKSPNGNMFYFNIKSSNGKVIAVSELFEEKEIRDSYITSIKSDALNAVIEEDRRAKSMTRELSWCF